MKTHCSDCCSPQSVSPESCGCCEGVEIVTPLPTYNRPGLSEIKYRFGTHASFLETMTARLTGYFLEKPDADGNLKKVYPLQGLTTRDKSDPSIALLDAWASVGDVMTFYQERIANEGYLRTATERRSILELSRLVGYKPRPGVSSSVFLAYNIDDNFKEETVLPIGSRAQSIPGPDELPQAFETSDELTARAQWNDLKPRMSQPQSSSSILSGNKDSTNLGPRVYLKGVSTNLKVNDPLLIQVGSEIPEFHRVKEIELDPLADRTLVTLEGSNTAPNPGAKSLNLFNELALRASIQPRGTLRLRRNIADQFKFKASAGYSSVASFTPRLKPILRTAAANANISQESEIKVFALKVTAPLFGHNSLKEADYGTSSEFTPCHLLPQSQWAEWIPDGESGDILHLDRVYDQLVSSSYIAVQKVSQDSPTVFSSKSVQTISRYAYGTGAEATRVIIDGSWWDPETDTATISDIRTTKVYAQPEELELAEEPIQTPICGGTDDDDLIELDGFYEGLESGRWVIVSGEREIRGTSGVRFSELAMISSVTQDVKKEDGITERPNEKTHTFVKLAEKLAYCFKRDTVTIHGNVVRATHGESRHEVLGSGSGAQTFQSFELKQFPLTHVSANNPTGIDSSLEVIVNDIEWHETDSLSELKANDRNFITKTDNEDKSKIIFGNGVKGSRLPTGTENIRARYRSGIGKDGNVNAEQISMLSTKPLGVKEVINPLPASGGANRETRDQARKNVPLAIKALERLVSVQDYQDFSRVYAGIGKAHAVEISDGRQQLVHVTIAGAEDIPIEESSDLFRNLRTALHDFGDPQQAIKLAVRELMFISLEADIAILPDYQWETVEPMIRQSLLNAFGFEKRELGQSVVLSEVIKTMQSVKGVVYVDVNAFGGIPEKRALFPRELNEKIAEIVEKKLDVQKELASVLQRLILSPDEITNEVSQIIEVGVKQYVTVNLPGVIKIESDPYSLKHIRPAQLAFLTPEIPSTLILNQIESTS